MVFHGSHWDIPEGRHHSFCLVSLTSLTGCKGLSRSLASGCCVHDVSGTRLAPCTPQRIYSSEQPRKRAATIPLFYARKLNSKKLGNLPKVPQLIGSRTEIQTYIGVIPKLTRNTLGWDYTLFTFVFPTGAGTLLDR